MHETCLISDMTWALGYLYMITGNPKYGDWIENAVFNAGIGSVDDDFKSNQYFSCPNQVIANDTCNHAKFYRGYEWMSFSPMQLGGCCVGNVNRFMPNFAYHAWMRDEDDLSALCYCPSDISLEMGGTSVTIHEITNYPFENTVRFQVEAAAPARFTLVLRKPQWALSATLTVNGEVIPGEFKGNVYRLDRTFRNGDEITLTFTDEITLVENAGGISVRKGALLYALPVKERVVIEGLRETGNTEFPHYSLYADSQWNYGIPNTTEGITFSCDAPLGDQPWRAAGNSLRITLRGQELPNWKLRTFKRIQSRLLPRDPCRWVDRPATFTPKVPPVTADTPLGEKAELTLVPYCTTRLRIAIFPKISE
jgi:hypothetical protein